MNNSIVVKGTVQVEDMRFSDIEGGFGPGKKAMLAKDIAEIHGRELKVINQAINMNRKRFKDGLHIIDIKGTDFEVNLIDLKIISLKSAGNTNNIYLLSERGYAILLKILEDDVAWEQYEKLVDGYFAIRATNGSKLRKERTKPVDIVFRQQLNIAKAFSNISGVALGIALASAINKAEKLTGEDFDCWKRLLPARVDEKLIPNLNSTQLGAIIGLTAQDMNRRLETAGFQVKSGKKWRLTEAGKQHGEEYPFEKNGHSDYYIRWRESAAEVVKKVE